MHAVRCARSIVAVIPGAVAALFLAGAAWAAADTASPLDVTFARKDPEAFCMMLEQRAAAAARAMTPDFTAGGDDPDFEVAVAGAAWTSYPSDPGGTRVEPSAMFDPTRNRIVVFGGQGSSGLLNDVRILNLASGTWSTLTPSGSPPSARCGHSAVYDVVRDRMIVYGGGSQYYSTNTDVWVLTFAGTPTWSQLSPTGTPPPAYSYTARAVYDVLRDRLIVIHAAGTFFTLSLGATPAWTYTIPIDSPWAGGFGFSAMYDQPRDRILAFGGWWDVLCGPIPYSNFVSELRLDQLPITWNPLTVTGTPPAPRAYATLVRDSNNDVALLFGGNKDGVFNPTGGTFYNDVWRLTLGASPAWQQLSPSGTVPAARASHAAAYGSTNRRMVVFGGQNTTGARSDVPALDRNDVTPPATVTDFSASIRCEAIDFTWTAPGDDGTTGTALSYQIRKLTSAPLTNANWNSGTLVVEGSSGAAGSTQTYEYPIGGCSTRAHYAVRVVDAAGNWNGTSNGTGKIGTPCLQPPLECYDAAPGQRVVGRLELSVQSNPTRGPVIIRYETAAEENGANFDLSIYDVAGRRIESLATGTATAGRQSVRWDLRGAGGSRIPAGVYHVRLRVGGRIAARPLVIL